MTDLTYLISLRDNIEGFQVTGSTLYPYFPPTGASLSASSVSGSYYTTQSTDSFVGWEVNRLTTGSKPQSNGFRIQTPGYEDLILFAQDSSGRPLQPTDEGLIDVGVFNLVRSTVNSQKEIASLQQVDSKNILQNSPNTEKAKGLDKLGQILTERSANLKTIVIAAIVPQITQFGISNIKELLEKNANVEEALNKLPIKCPTPEKLRELITLRNRYATQLNNFFNSVSKLSQSVTGTNKVAEALTTGLQVLSVARKAANIALGFLPVTPGAAVSVLNVQKDLEDTIKPILNKLTKTLGILTSVVAFVLGILTTIIQLLNLLDTLILLCAKQQGIPYEDINAQLAVLNDGLINNLQNTTPTQQNTYKGFKFEIVLDTSVDFKYPKRYAVAKDKYNVILLKSQSSFVPNPELLIQELKFIIDRDNLSAE